MAHLSRRAFVAGLGASLLPWQTGVAKETKVVVVGAGLAGLAAAWDLTEAGVDVTLIEQSMRAGGRVKTVRGHFADDAWIDVGGQTTGAFYANFFYYSALFELPFEAQQEFRQRPDYLLHFNDQLLSGAALHAGDAPWPVNLHEHERPLAPFRLLSSYLTPIAKKIGAVENVLSPEFLPYDALTLRQLLLRQGASDAAVRLIDHTLNYNSVDTVSALSVLRDTVRRMHMQGGQALNLDNGNSSLPEAFAKRLSEHIRYGCRLTAVGRMNSGVQLQVETNGERESLYADYVVLAIPFTALRRIDITPALPTSRQAIISELPYTQIVQAWLQTKTRFWEQRAPVSMVVSDGPLERLFDASRKMSGERGMLINWINGTGAKRVSGRTAEEHVEEVKRQISVVWPQAKGQFEAAMSNDWSQSYAEGAYAHYAPGQMAAYAAEIPKPLGRLHFAGEHTELVAPGMEGALTSGRRAAEEILGALN